jgi:NAD(P)-dependent dehydrogenase (short-subunit alcohol dehydrogenase family)
MKVAVVTGIARSSGIGHAICSTLLENGLAVVGIDKNVLDPSSVLPAEYPNRFRFRSCSVDDDAGKLRRSLLAALEELGESCISVVVNNAGIAYPNMPDYVEQSNMSDEEKELNRLESRLGGYDKYIQNNLRSAFLVTEVCKPFFPIPRPRDGTTSIPTASIINISSVHAHASESPSSQEGYASAKSGIIGLTHAQGQSLAGKARVNVILPGWIDTDDVKNTANPSDQAHAWHAVGRVGKPNDIAEMVAFLADEERSAFVSCQEFVVDGGVSKRMYYPA